MFTRVFYKTAEKVSLLSIHELKAMGTFLRVTLEDKAIRSRHVKRDARYFFKKRHEAKQLKAAASQSKIGRPSEEHTASFKDSLEVKVVPCTFKPAVLAHENLESLRLSLRDRPRQGYPEWVPNLDSENLEGRPSWEDRVRTAGWTVRDAFTILAVHNRCRDPEDSKAIEREFSTLPAPVAGYLRPYYNSVSDILFPNLGSIFGGRRVSPTDVWRSFTPKGSRTTRESGISFVPSYRIPSRTKRLGFIPT